MPASPVDVVRFVARSAKRIVVTVVGAAFVLAGVAMLVLPGPGFLVVALGFAILGIEYVWAAVALERARRVAAQAGGLARDGASRAASGVRGTARSVGRSVRRR